MYRRSMGGQVRPSTYAIAFVVAVLASVVAIGAAAADSGAETKGRIPSEAWRADGSFDESLVPDYIPAIDRSGKEVGWVSTRDLGIRSGGEPDIDITVYADDLRTVVGTMIEGRGFVPVGQAIKSVPTFEVWTSPK